MVEQNNNYSIDPRLSRRSSSTELSAVGLMSEELPRSLFKKPLRTVNNKIIEIPHTIFKQKVNKPISSRNRA